MHCTIDASWIAGCAQKMIVETVRRRSNDKEIA
jgi:hypothetical protein